MTKKNVSKDPCQTCRKCGETTCGNDTRQHSCWEGFVPEDDEGTTFADAAWGAYRVLRGVSKKKG